VSPGSGLSRGEVARHQCSVAIATVFFNIYIQFCVVELRPTQYIYRIYVSKDQPGHAMTHLFEALSYTPEGCCHWKFLLT